MSSNSPSSENESVLLLKFPLMFVDGIAVPATGSPGVSLLPLISHSKLVIKPRASTLGIPNPFPCLPARPILVFSPTEAHARLTTSNSFPSRPGIHGVGTVTQITLCQLLAQKHRGSCLLTGESNPLSLALQAPPRPRPVHLSHFARPFERR